MLWATGSEGLAQRPYVAARVGFEPATFRTQGTESTTEPPHPTKCTDLSVFLWIPPRNLHCSQPPTFHCRLKRMLTDCCIFDLVMTSSRKGFRQRVLAQLQQLSTSPPAGLLRSNVTMQEQQHFHVSVSQLHLLF